MAEYQYKCSQCRNTFITNDREHIPPCPVCGHLARRQFIFNARLSNPEHFNHTVGGYVSNDYEIREAFKRLSDEQSERNGIEHNYEYLTRAEMADPTALGVTNEGLEETMRATYVAD